MNRRLSLLAVLLAPMVSAEDALTEAHKANLEKHTCQAWHGRRVAELRVEADRRAGVWDFALACEPHEVIRGLALRATAHCTGIDPLWTCEVGAPQIDLAPGNWQHPLSFDETTPERALDVEKEEFGPLLRRRPGSSSVAASP